MRRLLIVFLIISLCTCKTKYRKPENFGNTYWLRLKDSFYLQNVKDFIPDSGIVADFFNKKPSKVFHQVKDKILDSIVEGRYYLYSWQKQDSAFTAFTIIDEGFGECFEIRLLTFGKANNLISDIVVAKFGAEPGSYEYKSESHFKANDTFLTLHTRTYSIDELTLKKLSKVVGDSIRLIQYFEKGGKINSKIIDSNFTSDRYKDKNGQVTEKMIKKIDHLRVVDLGKVDNPI